MNGIRMASLALPLALLAGCATVPQPLQGAYQQGVPTTDIPAGTAVRWGGRLVGTANLPDETCFEILGKPLASDSSRPRLTDDIASRFMACQPGFTDPEAHTQGTEVTVAGRVTAQMPRKVGDHVLMEARVDAEAIHWWAPRPMVSPYPYGDPWFYGGPWGPGRWPYGGFYGSGFYGGFGGSYHPVHMGPAGGWHGGPPGSGMHPGGHH